MVLVNKIITDVTFLGTSFGTVQTTILVTEIITDVTFLGTGLGTIQTTILVTTTLTCTRVLIGYHTWNCANSLHIVI